MIFLKRKLVVSSVKLEANAIEELQNLEFRNGRCSSADCLHRERFAGERGSRNFNTRTAGGVDFRPPPQVFRR